jgi:tetratricopeptide (TPR) repeat protein
MVSEHPASLEELVPSLLAAGGQTDDLSLIRVGYLEDPPFEETMIPPEYSAHRDRARALGKDERIQEAIQELERAIAIRDEVAEDVLLLARLHRREKNYARAAELYIHLTQLEPIETRYLYDAALMLKLSRDFIRAADFGERCRLRDPEHLKNLLNLADVYRGLKHYDRSEAVLGRVLAREPENPEALLLKQALDGRARSS